MITKKERFLGSLFLGIIGDAIGSGFENISKKLQKPKLFILLVNPKRKSPNGISLMIIS
ncbi:hypothetical protein [Aquimarina sp. RZ0]|uniref:hypothetical protein n=1 Tax=Aquimarina sp. RZ0 TaxID=2607730 RepID=UPI00165F95D6|nr:hypothetical protein [Aquimarina sp. RZ0]